ncbi:MAG: C10 family peptidase [Bacteroidales bacterium]|nr:C10 family peptidase [Bacteroidales bacterium]
MNELPVIFGGNRYENLFSWPGHAFVIDGYHSYRNVTHFIYEWVYDEPGIQFGFHPPYETLSYSSPIVDWYKINWGYGNNYGENDIECSTNGIWTNPLIRGATPYEYSRIMMYGFSTL